MDLFDLDDHIPNLGIDPSTEHLEELYQLFKSDFIDNVFYFDGSKVIIDSRNSKEDGFKNYPHTFVKIITRGNKGKRAFDKKRANKIHWIRPILETRRKNQRLFLVQRGIFFSCYGKNNARLCYCFLFSY